MIDFLKGLAIGAIISFPVGPIGILCLRRMLFRGPLIGFAAGLGAATADMLYALSALFGLSFISQLIEQHFFLIKLLCSLFLCVLGFKIYSSSPAIKKQTQRVSSIVQSYLSTFFLTFSNPLIIISFLAFFAIFHVDSNSINTTIIPLSLGLSLGLIIWWILLAIFTPFIHPKLTPSTLNRINHFSGLIIFLLGIFGLLTLFV